MEKILHTKVWLRVAGHADMIKASTLYHWRCFINKVGSEIALKEWRVSGEATFSNLIPGTNTKKDENGLIAWIDLFGDVTIENDIATITLHEPSE